ncbi:MAG TPA: response regulator [Desulfohalobiaceae bacterium]|nr:response regulator [Desulfohalobiaceae bacterium]
MNTVQTETGVSSFSSNPFNVLLVEDEQSVANGLKLILDDAGYNVDLALNGQKALDIFKGNGVDLVVSDLRLPDIDGMDVIREIKTQKPATEIIVITGYPSLDSAIDSGRLGVREYLRKPFTEEEFMGSVNKAMQDRQEVSFESFFDRTKEGRLIQKREVVRILDRTAADQVFWRELMEQGSEALTEYTLSSQAKAAIVSGDLNWINGHVGELTQKQLRFIYKRLEQEAW